MIHCYRLKAWCTGCGLVGFTGENLSAQLLPSTPFTGFFRCFKLSEKLFGKDEPTLQASLHPTYNTSNIKNTLYYGDNLEILRKYIPDESVDLIYLDPR